MATTLSSKSPIPRRPASDATGRLSATHRPSSSLSSTVVRRQSLKTSPRPQRNGDVRETNTESLSVALKQETEKKEELLVYLQDKDQIIASLTAENAELSSALNAAQHSVNERYADHRRLEDEMATRIEVTEKIRQQVRDLEREKRDIQRRYNEQTATFEAERQSFYDNEQHLKSRIQSLTQARKQTEITSPSEDEPETEEHESEELENKIPDVPQIQTQNFNDPETEPAEMTSLRLELSTLSTSYSSLQSTLALLRTQLVDLKRVNHELQEENESFMILLRERTLSGQFDVMKQVDSNTSSEEGEEDADESEDVGSIKSIGHGTLGTVEEMPEESEPGLDPHVPESHPSSSRRRRGEAARKRGSLEPVDKPRGESLADLPITGPGLDLASELGRAESKDVLESPGDSVVKSKRGKKDHRKSLLSDDGQGPEQVNVTTHIDALRLEVKSLKDANKALSLYASKIIDRIISVEGFEHVLAVDYDKEPTPSNASKPAPAPVAKPPAKQPRPQSLMVNRSTSSPVPSLDSFKFGSSPQTAVPKTPVPATPAKANRRSLSFDWKSFSMFSGEKKAENPSLRPLKLKPGSNAVTGARKLETEEDDDDRRERERLNATMKLMGITQASQSPTITTSVPMQRNSSSPATASSATTPNQSRFSFFRSLSTTNSETASLNSVNSNLRFSVGGDSPSNLTTEALRQAEAEESLAALDAHERALSAEIARGASGGLTEILPRSFHGEERSRRSRKSRESGSTVWSAGMEDNL